MSAFPADKSLGHYETGTADHLSNTTEAFTVRCMDLLPTAFVNSASHKS